MSMNRDINVLFERGVKFVVIGDAAIFGCGDTPDQAWTDAMSRYPDNELRDAQCYDAAPDGAMVSRWHTRDREDDD